MLNPAAKTFDHANDGRPLAHHPKRAKLLSGVVVAVFTALLLAANLYVLGGSRRLILSTALIALTAAFAASLMLADRATGA
jgi:high-affinity Fe2+/Pb2+ permease